MHTTYKTKTTSPQRRRTYSNTRTKTSSTRRRRSGIPPPRRRPRFSFRWYWLAFIIGIFFLGSYVSELDVQVRAQFEGKRWELPARVFARPLELYTGMYLKADTLTEELNTLGYQHTSSPNKPGQYQRNKDELLITTRAFKFWDANDPSRTVRVRFVKDKVKSIHELEPSRKLALLRLEPQLIGKIYPTHHEDRILVRLNEIPQTLIDAIIAMEDRNFYDHWGISIRGMTRAFLANIMAGSRVQGGSTLTQQLVKNFYLTPERTLKRKLNEAIMAMLLEWHYSKEDILEAYINEVYLGQAGNNAVHGMGLAARFYFNRPLKELDLPHFALLVNLVRGASIYNPRRHPERARKRRNLVLDVMAAQEKITEDEAKLAKAAELGVTEYKTESAFPYPAFLELVRNQLRDYYDEKDLSEEGLQIVTTLDPVIQKAGVKAMTDGIKAIEERFKKWTRVRNIQGAMIVTGSQNGEVLAMVNGRKTNYAGFNRPLNAERQIGSLVKPAVYLTALEQNHIYDLITLLNDDPYLFRTKKGKVWKPKNYDGRFHGMVPLYHALANSYNISTVRLGMEHLGLDKIAKTLERLGVERKLKKYPSMLLGSFTLTPLEVTKMYQTIASNGFRVPLRAIRDVLDRDGKPLQSYALSVEQRFDAGPIFLLNYAMQHAVREGTGRYIIRTLPKDMVDDILDKKMVFAGKTGTSNESKDSWFVGFGSDLLAVTWVGRDDNKPMGLTGASGAMVIWRDFIKTIRPQSLQPVTPNGIQWQWHTVNVPKKIKGKIEIVEKRMRFPFIVGQNVARRALAENRFGF